MKIIDKFMNKLSYIEQQRKSKLLQFVQSHEKREVLVLRLGLRA